MTQVFQEPCDVYRHGDVSDRLHLFLTFPEMRIPFLKIDQEEMAADHITSEGKGDRNRSGTLRLIRRTARLISDAQKARASDCNPVTPSFR